MIQNTSPRHKEVDGVIIHSMGEYIGEDYAIDFLEKVGLSAHFFITPDGFIIHGAPTERVAWHAGQSQFGDQKNLNSTFIGIEIMIAGSHTYATFLEAIKSPDAFSQNVYESVASVIGDLMEIYPKITLDRIVRHSDVSGADVRTDPKHDPGIGFDMDKLKKLVEDEIA